MPLWQRFQRLQSHGPLPSFPDQQKRRQRVRAAVCVLLGSPARSGVQYVESAPAVSFFLPASRFTAWLPSTEAPSRLLNASGLPPISLSMKLR